MRKFDRQNIRPMINSPWMWFAPSTGVKVAITLRSHLDPYATTSMSLMSMIQQGAVEIQVEVETDDDEGPKQIDYSPVIREGIIAIGTALGKTGTKQEQDVDSYDRPNAGDLILTASGDLEVIQATTRDIKGVYSYTTAKGTVSEKDVLAVYRASYLKPEDATPDTNQILATAIEALTAKLNPPTPTPSA